MKRFNDRLSTLIPAFALIFILCFLMIIKNVEYTEENIDNDNAEAKIDFYFTSKIPIVPVATATPKHEAPKTTPQTTSISYSEGIKVYKESFSSELSGIDWGTIFIGIPKSFHFFVMNTGDRPIILYLSVANWTPGVNGTITWNYDGNTVRANTPIPITLSLKIESANVTAFSNDIHITFTSV